MVKGAFFQDMIHSGMNAYLTLHLAQVLLRAGDRRFEALVRVVAEMASPTGQWPEAVHPHTGGGCMGDGQHVWAAAEWMMMMRNLFLREEGDRLLLLAGIPAAWVADGERLTFGPGPTSFGVVEIEAEGGTDAVRVGWRATWRGEPPEMEFRLGGFEFRTQPGTAAGELFLRRLGGALRP